MGLLLLILSDQEEAYEDMVARRVAEYVAQGRQHLLSSALTQVIFCSNYEHIVF